MEMKIFSIISLVMILVVVSIQIIKAATKSEEDIEEERKMDRKKREFTKSRSVDLSKTEEYRGGLGIVKFIKDIFLLVRRFWITLSINLVTFITQAIFMRI